MSQRIISLTICDSCGRNDADSGVDFVNTVNVRGGRKVLEGTPLSKRLDVCFDCDENGCFVCYRCAKVHKHETECPELREELLCKSGDSCWELKSITRSIGVAEYDGYCETCAQEIAEQELAA